MVKKILMSPESSFGGWLSADILNRKQEKSILNYIKNSFPDLFWRLNPYYPSGFKETGLYLRDDTTQAINLSCGMKNILCKWAHGHRSALNKAKKLGVTARVASSKDDWKEYKKLYKDTLKRWGESAIAEYTYRQELFDIFFRLNSPNVKLWLAEYKENVISGYLALYGPKNCILWHSATLERYFELRPTQLIVYEALKDACKNHLNWLDFNPSGPLKGVKVWKQRFGAEELPCPIYIKKSRITLAIETMNAMLHRHPVKMTLNKNPLPH
jgi:hypothetical protein